MFRLLLLTGAACVAVLFVSAAPAQAPEPSAVELMPGVTYQKDVDFTPHGPVVIHVVTGPQPGGLYSLTPVMGGGGTILGGREQLTQIEKDVSAAATVVGINGDFFSAKDGHPTGIYLQDGVLTHSPASGRSSIGIDPAGGLHVKRFGFVGTWKGTGQRRPLNGLNQVPRGNRVVLFTPAWGTTTPQVANAVEAVLEPFGPASPDTDLSANVGSVATGGGTTIPADGAVLMAVGAQAAKLQAEAPVGAGVTTRLILPSDWSGIKAAIGGGPVLVRRGKPVFHSGESFRPDDLTTRDARAGVGQLADGRFILVAVDGGRPGASVGMTTYELAKTMAQLGAVTAAGVAGGASVAAAFDGQLLSRPSGPAEQAVKDVLLLQYYGVYAPPPPVRVVSKATVAAGEQLAYKLVRPSTVTASVVGPDGQAHPVDSGTRQPGTYRFTWTAFDAEGTWHWNIKATDDLGRESSVDQVFGYDLTLSSLGVPRTADAKAGLEVAFTLSRPAQVALRVETPFGTVVSSAPSIQAPAGQGSIHWDGTLDGTTKAYPGAYVAKLTATSSVGTMDLSAPFTLRG